MLRLPEIFQSNMVLQYNHPVKVWGMSDPAESVQIEIQSQSISTVSDEQGNWQVLLEPLEISYDESLTVRTSKEEWRAEHVAAGAVWIAGGQSNMEFFMKYEKHYEEELENCENALLRFFDVPKIAFDGQRETFDYSEYAVWRDCNRENLGYFSAVGYYFQKMIAERLKMPVGIIGCNWGGTTASAWMSKETLERLDNVWFHQYRERTREIDWTHYYEEEKKNPENNKGALYHDAFNEFFMSRTPAAEEAEEFFKNMPPYDLNHMQPQTVPGCLFDHMLKSIAPYTVTGVLWYQGESDDEAVGQQEIYQVMLRSMIEDWRKELDCPDLPFLIVQLPGFKKWLFVENQDWSKIRKAQESVADADENVMLCSISDAGEEWDIHPKDKKIVGERLALLARKYIYGEPELLADAPRIRECRRTEQGTVLLFDHAETGLNVKGNVLQALTVTVGEKEVHYSYEINGNQLRLYYQAPEHDSVRIRFAQSEYYEVNLYNESRIPAVPFELVIR